MYIRSNLESTCHCLLAACLLLSQHTQTTKTHVSSLAHASFLSSPVHYAATAARDYLIRFELPSEGPLGSLLTDAPGGFLLAFVAPVCGSDLTALGDGPACIRRREDLISCLNFSIAGVLRATFTDLLRHGTSRDRHSGFS